MSRERPGPHRPCRCFPRVSGDEPFIKTVKTDDGKFSPRERG